MHSNQKRSVIVTGGSRGVGRAVAEHFLRNGDAVYICGRKTPASPPTANGEAAVFIPADIRDPENAANVVDQCVKQTGRVDILINNAGGGPPGMAIEASPQLIEKVIALNLTAPFIMAQKAAMVMRAQPSGGAIVNIASVSGVRPSPETAAYGAAKAGLINLTQSLAQEWAPLIRVNCLVVGPVATEAALDHYGGREGIQKIEATMPMKRMARPEDIAAACGFLTSPEAAYITGASLEVHGGGERPFFLETVKRLLGEQNNA